MKSNPIRIRPMAPPPEDSILQPLREVGSATKTQYWDLDDIQSALREANRRGIPVESLFANHHHPSTDRLGRHRPESGGR